MDVAKAEAIATDGAARQRVRGAWGADPPDWVTALANACDEQSQAKAAAAIKYSASVVNQVLARVYAGNIEKVERAVRNVYLPEQVACPILGEITTTRCAETQARPLSTANPLRIALARQCRFCPNYQGDKSP